jgi:regulatory protein
LEDNISDRDIGEDVTEQQSEPTKRMLSWAKNSALYRLQRQMLSEKQLSQAIAKKARQKFDGISAEQVSALSKHAVEFGYLVKALDDKNYAEVTTRSALRAGKSKRQITERLKLKGVETELIANTVEDVNDLQSALILARKRRFGPFRREEVDEKRKNKELSAFGRAGFSFEISKRVFNMSLDDAEELMQANSDL